MRGQSGVEFMILFGVFLLAIIIMVFSIWNYVFDINVSTNDLHANKFLDSVSSRVDTVFLEGDGFLTNYTMPDTILGRNYSVSIERGFVFLNFSGRVYVKRLITKNVTGNLEKGENTIKNVNGVVAIL